MTINVWGARGNPVAEYNNTLRQRFAAWFWYESAGSDDFGPRPMQWIPVDYSQNLVEGNWYYDAPYSGYGDNETGGPTPLRYHPAIGADCQLGEDATGASCYGLYLQNLRVSIENPTINGVMYRRLGNDIAAADLQSIDSGGGAYHVFYDAQNGYLMRRDDYEALFHINQISIWSLLRPAAIMAALVVTGGAITAATAGSAATAGAVVETAAVETATTAAIETAVTDVAAEAAAIETAVTNVAAEAAADVAADAVADAVAQSITQATAEAAAEAAADVAAELGTEAAADAVSQAVAEAATQAEIAADAYAEAQTVLEQSVLDSLPETLPDLLPEGLPQIPQAVTDVVKKVVTGILTSQIAQAVNGVTRPASMRYVPPVPDTGSMPPVSSVDAGNAGPLLAAGVVLLSVMLGR